MTATSSQPTVGLVTIWSGPLPAYLPLFLLTAGANRDVDFIFVADSPPKSSLRLPPNVRWLECSWPDLLRSMGERLGLDLPDAAPYKACDYKPAFGIALGNLLEGYDFWGHVDCDVVLGSVRHAATADRLQFHDLLTFRGRGFVHGPLTLYRNLDRVNRLFELAPDWRRTFSDPGHYAFDETCRRWAGPRPTRPAPPVPPAERAAAGQPVSFTDVAFTEAAAGRLRVFDENHVLEADPARRPLRLQYEGGRLNGAYPSGTSPREFVLYHLIKAKQDPAFHVPAWGALPERFVITRAGVWRGPDASASERAEFAGRYVLGRLRARGRQANADLRFRAGAVRRVFYPAR